MTALTAGWDRLRTERPLPALWEILLLPTAILAGCLFVVQPALIALPVVLLLAIPLLTSPRVRVVYLVLGTVSVFGPPELNTSKLLFLLGVGIAFVGAFFHSRTLIRTPAYADLKPLFQASFALMVVVVLSLSVAHFNGVPDQDWLRDVAPYVLLALAPLFALDAQSAFGVRGLSRLIAIVGLTSAMFFTAAWYERRGLATSFTSEYGLATLLLSAAVFSFAIAVALDADTGRLRWLALATLVFAMLATTGTRSAAVLLAAPLAILFGTRRRFAQRSFRLLIALPIAAVLVVLSAQALLKLVDADPQIVSARLEVLGQSGGTSDDSYQNRLNAMSSAWSLFKSAPILGVGPGYPIPWIEAGGSSQANTFVDTSVGFLPDFGVIGLLVVGFVVASFISTVRRLNRRTGIRTGFQLGLIGFGVVFLAYLPLQVPFEDKGLSIGVLLLLAISVRQASDIEAGARLSQPVEDWKMQTLRSTGRE